MNSEFVNAFIKRQRALIDDLQSRLLIAETTIEISNQENTNLKATIESLSQTNKKSKAAQAE
jgi:hypothetical protein